MLRFRFSLFDLDDVLKMHAGDARKCLDMSSLSYGYFWMELGGQELFRIVEDVEEGALPYLDYPVQWQMAYVCNWVGVARHPVPREVADWVDDDPASWDALIGEALQCESDDADDAYLVSGHCLHVGGVTWWLDRGFDAGNVVEKPQVHLWRVDDTVRVWWQSSLEGEARLWAPVGGYVRFDYALFERAVDEFEATFVCALRERIDGLFSDERFSELHDECEVLRKRFMAYVPRLAAGLRPPPCDRWDAARAVFSNRYFLAAKEKLELRGYRFPAIEGS